MTNQLRIARPCPGMLVAMSMLVWSLGTPTPGSADTCVSPPAGIVAWWPFDEISGATVADHVGLSPGAHVNGPAPAGGLAGGSLRFDGSNDYVAVADHDRWAFGTRDFTIELWANFDRAGSGSIGEPGDIFIGNDEGPGTRRKWFFALGGGVLSFHLNGPQTGSVFLVRAPFSPVPGTWYHLAVTRSRSRYTIFVDGHVAGSANDARAVPNAAAALTIGQGENIGFMNGRLDEVTLYDRALDPVEIQAIYAAGGAGKCKALRVAPASAGRGGSATIVISGARFSDPPAVRLVRSDGAEVVAAAVNVVGETVGAVLDLTEAEEGAWDVEIVSPDRAPIRIVDAFTVEPLRAPDVWATVFGIPVIRPGRPQSFFVAYGNRGNVDALAVPLWIAGIPRDATVTVLSEVEDVPAVGGVDVNAAPMTIVVDDQQVVPLLVPWLGAGEQRIAEIQITIPAGQPTFVLTAQVLPPLFDALAVSTIRGRRLSAAEFDEGRALDFMQCATGALKFVGGFVIGSDCVLEALHALLEEVLEYRDSGRKRLFRQLKVLAKIVATCVLDFVPGKLVADFLDALREIFKGVYSGAGLIADCLAFFHPPSGPPPSPPARFEVQPVTSFDPNVKAGPVGVGDGHVVAGGRMLQYVVSFENLATATAPAQEVSIIDRLDVAAVDPSTVVLGFVGFGASRIVPPSPTGELAAELDLRPATSLVVRLVAAVDQNEGVVTWHLSALDPVTGGLPVDPRVGFLPPNAVPPEGEGYVTFSVALRAGLETGRTIDNAASIVFDSNDPIATPVWRNTVDDSPPTCAMHPLAAEQASPTFPVSWSSDDEGSGVAAHTIYVSVDDGPWTVLADGVAGTEVTVTGRAGARYAFACVATDRVGHLEWWDMAAEATTIVGVPATTVTTTTTTTSVPDPVTCVGAACPIQDILESDACRGRPVPARMLGALQRAHTAVERVVAAPARRRKILRRRATHALSRVARKASRLSRGRHPKLDGNCARAIRNAVVRTRDGLNVERGSSVDP